MYTEETLALAILRKSNAHDTAEVLSAAAAVYGGYLVCSQVKVKRFMFYVTVAVVAATTAPVVKVSRRPTYNSATGEVLIASMTIPTGTAAGKVLYKNCSSALNVLYPGEELSYEQTVQAADPGTAAGSGFYAVELELDPEAPGNQSNMIASA